MPPRKTLDDLKWDSFYDVSSTKDAAIALDRFFGPHAAHAAVSAAVSALGNRRLTDARFWLEVLDALPKTPTAVQHTARLTMFGKVAPKDAAEAVQVAFGDTAVLEIKGLIDHAKSQNWSDDAAYWTSVLAEMAEGSVH